MPDLKTSQFPAATELDGAQLAGVQGGQDRRFPAALFATPALVEQRINQLLNGAGSAYDTFADLQALMQADDTEMAALIIAVGGKLQKDQNLADLPSAAAARGNLGLGNVNNTSDANKPVSTAQQAAIDAVRDRVKFHTALIGDGAQATIAVVHGMGTQRLFPQIVEVATGQLILADVVATSDNAVSVTFSAPVPTNNQYRLNLLGWAA